MKNSDMDRIRELPVNEGIAEYRKIREQETAEEEVRARERALSAKYARWRRERNVISVIYLAIFFFVVLINILLYGEFAPDRGEWIVIGLGAALTAYVWVRDWLVP